VRGAAPAPPCARRRLRAALVLIAFEVAAFALYRNALPAPLLSDDFPYLVYNPYVQELSAGNTLAIFDPDGPPVAYAMNYAPVHLLAHALGLAALGPDPRSHRAVNVALHAGVAGLLVLLLRRSGVPAGAALLGGSLFLVHPAHVETVVFVFELKTVLSTALAFAALLAFARRPALATALFGVALATKISAAFAWPVAAALAFAGRLAGPARGRGAWLAVWGLLLLAIAVPEFRVFQRGGGEHQASLEDLGVQLRSSVALVARYAWMAATSLGIGAFQQPEPARSLLDPWWLAGLGFLTLAGARLAGALHRRDPEAAWWLMAAASFAPVSQVFPFLYPLADRYLYTILPGLLGAFLLATRGPWGALGVSVGSRRAPRAPEARLGAGLAAAALALIVVFAWRSEARCWVFRSERSLRLEAARRHPEGLHAHLVAAERAARAGDGPAAARALESARRDGFVFFREVVESPALAPVLDDPAVAAVVREMAGWWVERVRRIARPFPIELYMAATAHEVRGEPAEAIAALERAIQQGGPHETVLRSELLRLRAATPPVPPTRAPSRPAGRERERRRMRNTSSEARRRRRGWSRRPASGGAGASRGPRRCRAPRRAGARRPARERSAASGSRSPPGSPPRSWSRGRARPA
jgi:hypothetical protein